MNILALRCSLILLVLCGCQPRTKAPENKEPVRIAVLNHILATPIVAALITDQDGLTCFDKAGLQPLIDKRSRGPEIVDALVSRSVDFGTMAITPQVLQILQGQSLILFLTYQTSDLDIKFVARKSAGITSPALVRGKRLGYVGGTYGEIFMDRYLATHGVPRSTVALTSGTPATLRDLFIRGSLDAIIVWEPTIQDIILDSAVDRSGLLIDVDRSIYTARVNLVALPETLRKDKAKAEKLTRALICAESNLRDQPALVQHNLEQWMDRRPGSLDGVFHPETFRVTLNVEKLKADLATEAQWATVSVFNGKAEIPSDFTRYIDTSIIQDVDPARLK